MNHTSHLVMVAAIVAVVAVAVLLGTPIGGGYVLLALILLICMPMMYFMMRGMPRDDAADQAEHDGLHQHSVGDGDGDGDGTDRRAGR